MKKSYIFLADGFEEIEALATYDMLCRAGIDVDLVSVYDNAVATGAHGVAVYTDETIGEINPDDADWLILPGGMPGASNLFDCKPLTDALRRHCDRGGNIAAICASPAVVLAPLGILDGRRATCYPGFEDALTAGGATATGSDVVVDGNVITGKGPGVTMQFALAIIKAAAGDETAAQVAAGMLIK